MKAESVVRPAVATTYIEQLIVEYFPEDPQTALAVAKAESELYPRASNWGDSHRGCYGSFGIFQIGCIHGSSVEDLYDVEYNIKKARQIYNDRGWTAWGAYTDGRYKQYLAMR